MDRSGAVSEKKKNLNSPFKKGLNVKTFIELFAVSSLLGLHSHDNTLPHINQLESSSLSEQVQGEKIYILILLAAMKPNVSKIKH